MDIVDKNIPKGIVAILIDNNGREIVSVSDFNRGVPAGFTCREIQGIRSREALAMKAMTALASPLLSDAITPYEASSILQKMCNNGCRVVLIPVGHDD